MGFCGNVRREITSDEQFSAGERRDAPDVPVGTNAGSKGIVNGAVGIEADNAVPAGYIEERPA